MFVMALSRGLPWYLDAQRQGVWDNDARKSPYVDLTVSTALINGVGGIGHETARILNELGMEVIGVDPRPEYELPFIQLHTPDELDEVLHRADFVITTVPHTPETEGMFNARRFELMKDSAYFININYTTTCTRCIGCSNRKVCNGIIEGLNTSTRFKSFTKGRISRSPLD